MTAGLALAVYTSWSLNPPVPLLCVRGIFLYMDKSESSGTFYSLNMPDDEKDASVEKNTTVMTKH